MELKNPLITTGRAESGLQKACVEWFRVQYRKHALMLFAVPNGGGRSRIESAIMKGEGVTAGVSDLILLEARGGWGALCIEMKTLSKKSKQSPAQLEWQRATENAGNRYEVCRTLEQFMSVVNDYMNLPATTSRVVIRGVASGEEILAGHLSGRKENHSWDK